jgi:hypothetical protein
VKPPAIDVASHTTRFWERFHLCARYSRVSAIASACFRLAAPSSLSVRVPFVQMSVFAASRGGRRGEHDVWLSLDPDARVSRRNEPGPRVALPPNNDSYARLHEAGEHRCCALRQTVQYRGGPSIWAQCERSLARV